MFSLGDLEPFLSHDECVTWKMAPVFSEGLGGACFIATDGKMCVALECDRISDCAAYVVDLSKQPSEESASRLRYTLFGEGSGQWESVLIPALNEKAACWNCKGTGIEEENCDFCRGTGNHECECGDEHACGFCAGAGGTRYWCSVCRGTGITRLPKSSKECVNAETQVGVVNRFWLEVVDRMFGPALVEVGEGSIARPFVRFSFDGGRAAMMKIRT
jgi:hypothetical protein